MASTANGTDLIHDTRLKQSTATPLDPLKSVWLRTLLQQCTACIFKQVGPHLKPKGKINWFTQANGLAGMADNTNENRFIIYQSTMLLAASQRAEITLAFVQLIVLRALEHLGRCKLGQKRRMIACVSSRPLDSLSIYHVIVLDAVSKHSTENDEPHEFGIALFQKLE
jgi:hypothetical protein